MTITATAKQAVHDDFESKLKAVEAKLEGVKAQAEAGKVALEIKAIAELSPRTRAIHHKLQELRTAGADRFEHAKAELQKEITDLEKSAKEIADRVKKS